jgi:hypothetical protein
MSENTEPVTQVTMTASVVYEEWPDGSRTARLSFWEEEPTVHYLGGEVMAPLSRGDAAPSPWVIRYAQQRMLDAFPDLEQPLPSLVMREVPR